MKFWSQNLQYLQISWIFHSSLRVWSAFAGNRQYIADLSIYYRDMTCFDGLYLKKSRSACTALQSSETKHWCFILAKRSTAQRAVKAQSARRVALLLATFDVVLPSEREKPSWIDWTIKIFPSTRWVSLDRFPARKSRFWVSHHATYCAHRSLTSYRPVVHTCSRFGACFRHRHLLSETARARRRRSLIILTAREPMGLSSRCRVL